MKLLEYLLLAGLVSGSTGAWYSGIHTCCRIYGRLPVCETPQQMWPLCCPQERMGETELAIWIDNNPSWQNGLVAVNDTGHFDFYNCLQQPETVFLIVKSRCYDKSVERWSKKHYCSSGAHIHIKYKNDVGRLFYVWPPPKDYNDNERNLATKIGIRPLIIPKRLEHCCRIRGGLTLCKTHQQKTPLCCPEVRLNEVAILIEGKDNKRHFGASPNRLGEFNFYTCGTDEKFNIKIVVESRCYSGPRVSVIAMSHSCHNNGNHNIDWLPGSVFYGENPKPKENLNENYICKHPPWPNSTRQS